MTTRLHSLLTWAEEALLARTLWGRVLEVDVCTSDGKTIFARGTEIDRAVLDRARELELLEELAHATEPGTSDTELQDFLWWRKRLREEEAAGGEAD